jgi:Fis family transcriptional regulator
MNIPKQKKKKKKAKKVVALHECVNLTLQQYLDDLGEEIPTQLYEFVIKEVEAPMLQVVMEYTRQNQSQAAEILGLNRGTLRKKLKEYNLL